MEEGYTDLRRRPRSTTIKSQKTILTGTEGIVGPSTAIRNVMGRRKKKNNCYELYAHLKENELSANTSLAFLSELQEYLDSSSSSVTNHCDFRLVT